MSRPWNKGPPPRRRLFNRLNAIAAALEAGADPADQAAEIRAVAVAIREKNRRRRAEEKKHERA